jgi:putative Mg2+ transporter-C (MgtC) family protein
MEILQNELASSLPSSEQAVRVILRLLVASALAGIIGYEREVSGKAAGVRTHMLVGLSCAAFVLAPLEAGMDLADVSRVLQGVVAGIGFIGAGSILKATSEREVQGLTTAAAVWMTAAMGIAAGLGRFGVAAFSVALAWMILVVVNRIAPTSGSDRTVSAGSVQKDA